MFKSKHSGWTWDLKRTPFGGGNPLDDLSKGLGTDGSGGGVLGGLAEVDKFVNREVPGGWTLPAALAVAYSTGYIDPSLFATEAAATAGAEAGAGAISTEAGQTAFFDALASGASSSEAVSAGMAADAAAAGTIAGGATDASLANGGTNAALQGPTYGELGVTGVEGGMAGPTYGELGYTGINGAADVAAADAAAASGLSAKDVLVNGSRAMTIANLLTNGLQGGKKIPNASQWATQAAQNFAQATPEQFGGYYQMNKNPFSFGTQGQTVASPGTYDVSGTNPMANALRKA
jgi:hypothetical protein